ncbi:reverse transcriptase domain-containing protein [Tanacetum coccineum]
MDKLILALVYAERIRRYFQAHPIRVLTDKPINQIIVRLKKSGRIAKWAIELGEHDIKFKGRNSVKGQILADFLAETSFTEEKETESNESEAAIEEPKTEDMWKLYTDGASSSDGSGADLMLVSPEGKEYTYALRFNFETTNNEADYEALLAGLRIATVLKIKDLSIFIDSQLVANQVKGSIQAKDIIQEVHQGSCGMHAGSQSMVSKIMMLGYYWPSMHVDTKADIQMCEACQIHSSVLRRPKQDMTSITLTWPFSQRGIIIVGPLPTTLGGVRFLVIAIDYFTKWVEVEVINRDIVKGMEHRLGNNHQGWVDEVPQVLWAHRTSPKSNNGETPFSLTYGLEAVVPIEISVETERIKELEVKKNDKRRQEDLDILEERRELLPLEKLITSKI